MPSDAATEPAIRDEEVERLARLANLELPEVEVKRLAGDLARILSYVKQLEELDLEGVPPTAYVELERPALRPDEPQESLPQETALREAPRTSMDGFAVPGFVEEDG